LSEIVFSELGELSRRYMKWVNQLAIRETKALFIDFEGGGRGAGKVAGHSTR
jgi:hypothetical protein